MSAMLAGEGKPPCVLTVKNANAYFDLSTLAKDSRKHSLQLFLRKPKLCKRFAELLKSEADWGFLKPWAISSVRNRRSRLQPVAVSN